MLRRLLKPALATSVVSFVCVNEYQRAKRRTMAYSNIFSFVRSGDIRGLSNHLETSKDSVNARHRSGYTPLHQAAANGNVQMVKVLLNAGGSVNEKQIGYASEDFSRLISPYAPVDGFTALHYGAALDNLELTQTLLQHGADPSIKDSRGFKAVDYCEGACKELLSNAETDYEERKAQKEKEMRRKFPLERHLREKIVGQEDVIARIGAAVRRKENGWTDEQKPLVFMFLGSSGIGKTEVAKQVAEYLSRGDSANRMVRLDMSEFQSKHEVSKFIGSPPGYVGYDEGGQLTEKLRKIPNAIVLLDEVEKAHVDVLTIMLQVFDEGRLTDGKGETVDCRDAIFIMTSNLAQDQIKTFTSRTRTENEQKDTEKKQDYKGKEDEMKKFMDETVYPILKRHFKRDEFIGRINEILVFKPFCKKELHQLVSKELEKWKSRAAKRHNISLSWTESVVDQLSLAYNEEYGARSIKNEVERKVVNLIAKLYEMDEVRDGGAVHFYAESAENEKERNIKVKVESVSGTATSEKKWFGIL